MSYPDGPAIPQSGQRGRNALEGNDLEPLAFTAPIHPEPPETPEVADMVSGPVLPYLTPDAMLVYCQSRLTGINTQCREIMTRQDKNAKAQAAMGDLLSTLYVSQDGATAEQKQYIRVAYAKAIDAVGPETALGKKLNKDLGTLNDQPNTIDKNTMQSVINSTKNYQSELNSDAEIDMIRLQSLMSQRQTAIQLTTNIIQSLNDQANKIVANIGH